MSGASQAAMDAELERTGNLKIFKPATPAEIDALPMRGTCQKCRQQVDLKQGEHRCGR